MVQNQIKKKEVLNKTFSLREYHSYTKSRAQAISASLKLRERSMFLLCYNHKEKCGWN